MTYNQVLDGINLKMNAFLWFSQFSIFSRIHADLQSKLYLTYFIKTAMSSQSKF